MEIEEETIYAEDFRDGLLEDDEISVEEAAFMSGWDGNHIQADSIDKEDFMESILERAEREVNEESYMSAAEANN